ncbi:MAG: nucleoside deaminase [Desulfomicrobium sp.]|nr:nucleoside deaminase [Desulfomicrobium sp.]
MPNKQDAYNSVNTSFTLGLPDWAVEELNALPKYLASVEERMAAVIEFSRRNFQRNTGGPFAAGIFERDSGRVVVIGVNRVMPFQCSSAHAEVMAISLAQKLLGVYDLGAPGLPAYQLVVNWRPCAMCFGAVLWSGVRSLVIAGEGTELEKITGFDEGPIHPDWRAELSRRGIEVVDDVLRVEALDAYREFAASQSFVYNARLGVD